MGAVYMEFEGVKLFPILELGLSQIYLDKSKIEEIERCDRSYSMLVLAPKENRNPLYCREPELYLYGMSEDLATWYYENEAGGLFFYRDGRLGREET